MTEEIIDKTVDRQTQSTREHFEGIERHFETINNYDFTWTDIQKPTRDNISTLGSQYPFHELNLDDSLSKIHIPKIDKYKDHLFILLNFPVNMQEEKHEYDIPKVSQLSIFLGISYLITIHQSKN